MTLIKKRKKKTPASLLLRKLSKSCVASQEHNVDAYGAITDGKMWSAYRRQKVETTMICTVNTSGFAEVDDQANRRDSDHHLPHTCFRIPPRLSSRRVGLLTGID